MIAAHRPVTAYLKPTDYCNIGCEHCYLPAAVRANKSRFTPTILDRAIDTINEMIRRQKSPGALVVWHGGEPLTLPVDWLDKACRRVSERIPDSIQTIQTSLIPYRSAWGEVISRHMGGHVGSSIDFSQRKLRGDVGRYQDLWLEKVALARSDGLTITPGVVPTRNEVGRGKEIVSWMLEHDFLTWNIDRYNAASGPDPNRPNNAQHSLFLTEVFDAVMDLAASDIFMQVNTVSAALRGVLRGLPGDRWGGGCSSEFIVVNPDGSTNACPDKISLESFGNIADSEDAFLASDARKAWIRKHLLHHSNSHCARCRFRSFCKSGCPLTPNTPESEGECAGYSRHLSHVETFARANEALVTRYIEALS